MKKQCGERNILIGIVAAREGLINLHQLESAFESWLADKATSLSEILIEQGALSASQRDQVEAMVDEQHAINASLADTVDITFTDSLKKFVEDSDFRQFVGKHLTVPPESEVSLKCPASVEPPLKPI